MKELLIDSSPRVGGNTAIALDEMVKVFSEESIALGKEKFWASKKRTKAIYEFYLKGI